MQQTKTAGTVRQAAIALFAVIGLAIVMSGCIPDQPNLKNAYLINTERIARGMRPFDWNDQLAAKARAWAQHMADANTVSHSILTDGVSGGWSSLGENVGAGTSVDEVHQAFLNSAEHRKAILSRSYDSMGIGIAEKNGQIWVVEVYRGG
jgi:uncharacterized protein YkwD